MNTKKIWLLAILFGLLMSFTFFILTSNKGNTNGVDENAEQTEQVEEMEKEKDTQITPLEIRAGKRAISIAVEEEQGVSGFIRPGSFVDIVVVNNLTDQDMVSNILLENIRVLAVGNTVTVTEEEEQEPYRLVTLEVSPLDGANLALEKERGTVTLMLRGVSEDVPAINDIPKKQ
ncbi:Flp pilus assembly protein CpaB [Bacillus tuaregi]|uniref:Flp pilus assembly protein CpaB n=1 Tax=Bacillus tuaregi TaxID=1816695 RepID=UPI0008F9671F|nr:Flp pilus assembly protein CpaB [Bacillus tuaregi]